MHQKTTHCILLLTFALCGALNAGVGLPFSATFESPDYATGSLDAQQSWSVSAGQVDVVATSAYEGQQSLQMLGSGSQASLALASVTPASVVFTHFAVRPQASILASGESLLEVEGSALAFFDAGSGKGEFYVYDGVAWVATGVLVDIDTNGYSSAWHSVLIRQDFAAGVKTWDLSIDGVPVVFDLPLTTAATAPSFLHLSGAGGTHFDALSLGHTNTAFPDADADGMGDVFEAGHGSATFTADRLADADNDAISNIDAYLSGVEDLPAYGSNDLRYYLKFSGDLSDASTQSIATSWKQLSGGYGFGVLGQGGKFDGSDYTETVSRPDALYDMSALTIAVWVKKSALSQDVELIWNHMRYGLSLKGSDQVGFHLWPGSLNAQSTVTVPALADKQWHHIAMTYDGNAQVGYVDGLEVLRVEGLSDGIVDNNGYKHHMRLGGVPWSDAFQGSLDEARVYGRALSAAEINLLSGEAGDSDGDGLSNAFENSHPEHDPFVAWQGGSGAVIHESWNEVSGASLGDLLADARFPYAPSDKTLTDSLYVGTSSIERNGNRLHGWIHAPVSGDYRFWVRGHNNAELWVSTSSHPKDLVKVASLEDGWSMAYDTHPSQKSALISLAKDQAYYFELRHMTPSPHFGIVEAAWEIPALPRTRISGAFISPTNGYTDADLDGMDDALELSYFAGLGSEPNEDADGDGIVNYVELLHGMNPILADAYGDGYALRELWTLNLGNSISTLLSDPFYPAEPHHVDAIDTLDVNVDFGQFYGQEINAYLHAPITGEYTFWLAGDDVAELHISTGEDPQNLVNIATVSAATQAHEWGKSSTQQSVKLSLVAGQRYYLKLRHKEYSWTDHLAVAWQLPGSPSREVITGHFLSPGLSANGQPVAVAILEDSDADGIHDAAEASLGTNAQLSDTDNDGINDGDEQWTGTDPLDAQNKPSADLGAWSLQTFGNAANAQAYQTDAGFALKGTGGRFSFKNDNVVLLEQPVQGDFSFTARVNDLYSTVNGFEPSAFLMVRESLDPVAAFVSTVVAPQLSHEGYNFELDIYNKTRAFADTDLLQRQITSIDIALPDFWIKVERRGGTLSTYYSDYGSNWSLHQEESIALPNAVHIAMGLSPASTEKAAVVHFDNIQVRLDSDRDGLYDDEELALGTDAQNADSDGDGVSDGDEVKDFLTDPLVAEFGAVTSIAQFSGESYSSLDGYFVKDSGAVIAREMNGSVDYALNLSQAGIYELQLWGHQDNSNSLVDTFDLEFWINGVSVGRKWLQAGQASAMLRLILPHLEAGSHTLTVQWHNTQFNTFLAIDALHINAIGGPDLNANGIADWIDQRVALTSAVDESLVTTAVSPYCLEGSSAQILSVAISSDYNPSAPDPMEPIIAQQGLKGQYYADVALNPEANTSISVSDEGGAASFAKTVTWLETNVVDTTEALLIRSGDQLLLAASTAQSAASDAVTFEIRNSGTLIDTLSTTVDTAIAYTFATAGDYTVDASIAEAAGTVTASATVQVRSADFGAAPIVFLSDVRQWDVPGLPAEASIEHDTTVSLSELSPASGVRRFELGAHTTDAARIIARLGEGGPVMAVAEVQALRNSSNAVTNWSIVETFADGSQLWEVTILLSDVPADLVAVVDIVKAGVSFLDGTTTQTFTAADFDEYGRLRYRLLKAEPDAGSTCNHVSFFQDGVKLN